jgi:hypothetical protein
MSLKSDVKIGSQRPQILNLPSGHRANAQGLDAVELAAEAGLLLDDWQAWLLTESLSESTPGKWSAFEVAVVVPRQNGKGSLLEARQLAGLFNLREPLQVHTAHEFKTCFEHFLRITNLIEGCPDMERQVQRVRRGAGEQAIELKTGQRLRFLARSGGSGRGLSGDAVYLDEAFALTAAQIGALLPTLSARPNPQVWYTSSAPKISSEVLHNLCRRGREGQSSRLLFAGWGVERTDDPADTANWFKANPALGIRISEEFVAAEFDAMRSMPEEFARERLGVGDLQATAARLVKLPADKWAATVGPDLDAAASIDVISFDVDVDGAKSSVAIASGSLSSPYVEVIDHRDGVGWLPARLAELVLKFTPTVVGVNGAGPAGAQIGPVLSAFSEAGISADLLVQLNTNAYKQACGGFYSDVIEGRLRRPAGQGPLDVAAGDAAERVLGDSWAWERRSSVAISPLVAVTVARALLPVFVPDVVYAGGFHDLNDFLED